MVKLLINYSFVVGLFSGLDGGRGGFLWNDTIDPKGESQHPPKKKSK